MSKKQPLGNFVQVLYARRKLLIQITILLGVIAAFAKLYPFEGVGEWTGIGKDSNKSVTTEQEINPKTKEVTKITKKETENFQSSKTLWDYLGLAGTIAIPFVLLYFERTQQNRSLQQAETEKKIADNNLREQALEAYFDKMSELLIDKQLKVLIGKKLKESDPEYSVLDAALNIVRVRTLSVLRRLDKDRERKGNVIRFLIDSELLSNLDLNSADLSRVHLRSADLRSANFSRAILSDADLTNAILSDADLSRADLTNAILSDAYLSRAILSDADLSRAILSDADLTNADLSRAILSDANLMNANLMNANLMNANLSGAKFRKIFRYGSDMDDTENRIVELQSESLFVAQQQIKAAKNWEQAKYDPKFRALLGLPPETPTTES